MTPHYSIPPIERAARDMRAGDRARSTEAATERLRRLARTVGQEIESGRVQAPALDELRAAESHLLRAIEAMEGD